MTVKNLKIKRTVSNISYTVEFTYISFLFCPDILNNQGFLMCHFCPLVFWPNILKWSCPSENWNMFWSCSTSLGTGSKFKYLELATVLSVVIRTDVFNDPLPSFEDDSQFHVLPVWSRILAPGDNILFNFCLLVFLPKLRFCIVYNFLSLFIDNWPQIADYIYRTDSFRTQ